MRPSISALAAVLLLAAGHALPAEEAPGKGKDDSFLVPVGSLGFSYPLIVLASGGILLPLGKRDRSNIFLDVPALRADLEAGLGGGGGSAGAFIPFADGSFALNLKAARLRTWLVPWNQEKDRTFDGVLVELDVFGHIPGKIGIGHFKDRQDAGNRFTSFFFGIGW